MTEKWKQYGGPCRRQCDVDKKTLVCRSCGMWYGQAGEEDEDSMSVDAEDEESKEEAVNLKS